MLTVYSSNPPTILPRENQKSGFPTGPWIRLPPLSRSSTSSTLGSRTGRARSSTPSPKKTGDFIRRYKDGERGADISRWSEVQPRTSISSPTSTALATSTAISLNGRLATTPRGRTGLALAYLDVDAHQPWQTDEYRGQNYPRRTCSPLAIFEHQAVGKMAILKIRYSTVDEFNDLADRLERTLAQLFLVPWHPLRY